MLERLLSASRTAGFQSQAHLARELNVSEDLIAQMLLDLERMGYIRRLEDSCDSHCAHCDLASSCAGANQFRCGRLPTRNCPSSSLRAMRTQESEGNGSWTMRVSPALRRNGMKSMRTGYGSAMPRG